LNDTALIKFLPNRKIFTSVYLYCRYIFFVFSGGLHGRIDNYKINKIIVMRILLVYAVDNEYLESGNISLKKFFKIDI
jgi:hypothetical protein